MQASGRRINNFSIGTVIIPWASFIVFTATGNIVLIDYIHVMTGAIWTGTDIFLGLIFSRVLKSVDFKTIASISKRIIPMTTYFIPSVSILTPAAGLVLALKLNAFLEFPNYFMWSMVILGLIIVGISFLLILPTSIKISKVESVKEEDLTFISINMKRLGQYAGIQLIFQVIIIGFMAILVVY